MNESFDPPDTAVIATVPDGHGAHMMLHAIDGMPELIDAIRSVTSALTASAPDHIDPGFPAFVGDGDTYRDASTQRTWTYRSANGWELTQDDIAGIRRT